MRPGLRDRAALVCFRRREASLADALSQRFLGLPSGFHRREGEAARGFDKTARFLGTCQLVRVARSRSRDDSCERKRLQPAARRSARDGCPSDELLNGSGLLDESEEKVEALSRSATAECLKDRVRLGLHVSFIVSGMKGRATTVWRLVAREVRLRPRWEA